MEPILIKPAPGAVRRLWLRRAAILFVALFVSGLLLFLVGPPLVARAAKAVVERRVVEVARALGREVAVGRLSSGLSDALIIEDVRLQSRDGRYTLLGVERIEVDFSLWDALWGRRAPSRVDLVGVRATLVLDRGRPSEVVDLVKGLRRQLARRAGRQDAKQDALPMVPEVHVTGEAVVTLDPGGEPAARLDEAELVLAREGGALVGRLSARVSGLGPGSTRVSGTLEARSLTDFTVEVRSAAPLEPTALLPVPVSVRGRGLLVASSREQTEVRLDEVEVPELASFRGLPLLGRIATHAGLILARQVRLTLSDDALTLLRSGRASMFASVRSITVQDASAHVVPALSGVSPLRLRGVNAALNRDRAGFVALRVDGEATAGRLGFSRFEAQASLAQHGKVEEVRLSLAGPIGVEVLSGLHSRLLPWPGARMDLTLIARQDESRWSLTGHAAASGLAYFWTKVCLVPVTDLGFEANLQATLDVAEGTVAIQLDPVRVGRATFALEAKVASLNRRPRIEIAFSLPRQPCDTVFQAIPRVLVPRLDGARFEGEMALQARLVADLQRPEKSSLTVTPDVEACRAKTLGKLVSVERLKNDDFILEIHESDYDKPIRVGPGTQEYVPIEDIPVVVQQAALATEDMAFFRHKGFRIGLINRAIKLNLSEGWYVYGGSTISQQLVKNLFLSREKTLARKLEEAIIVWEMERKVDKERILELYLNCIEFGRHVYGIRAAARTYFGKEVQDLTPMDAAFIMATKPAPRYAHKVYEGRSFNEWWVKRMKGILERLWREMHVIDERAARTPDPCPPGGPRGRYLVPCFYYPEEGVYAQPAVAPGTEVPPGMPENLPGGATPAPRPGPAEPITPPPGGEPGTR